MNERRRAARVGRTAAISLLVASVIGACGGSGGSGDGGISKTTALGGDAAAGVAGTSDNAAVGGADDAGGATESAGGDSGVASDGASGAALTGGDGGQGGADGAGGASGNGLCVDVPFLGAYRLKVHREQRYYWYSDHTTETNNPEDGTATLWLEQAHWTDSQGAIFGRIEADVGVEDAAPDKGPDQTAFEDGYVWYPPAGMAPSAGPDLGHPWST